MSEKEQAHGELGEMICSESILKTLAGEGRKLSSVTSSLAGSSISGSVSIKYDVLSTEGCTAEGTASMVTSDTMADSVESDESITASVGL